MAPERSKVAQRRIANRAEQATFGKSLLEMNGHHAANGEFFLASVILLIVGVFSKLVSSV
jgi:hypothetical protein